MSTSANFKIGLLAALIAVGGAASADAKSHDNKLRFQQIDANDDGAVTLEEIKAHRVARFASTDSNGDGFLTPEEMRGGEMAQRMLKRYDIDRNGSLDASELEAMGAERKMKRAAKMMKRADTNGDGKISLDEASARRDPVKMFERLDADNNGSLSAEEFAKAGGKRHKRAAD